MTENGPSYSTIFHCQEDALVCFLRLCQGIISVVMFVVFVRGYKTMSGEKNNPISNQDKKIYMLAMIQTLLLSCYYFLFEEFFVLATIRNFLIWIAINIFDLFSRIYCIEDPVTQAKFSKLVYFLTFLNFLSWFVIAVGDGSSIVNSNFNLGYNCRILDWVLLSCFLLAVTAAESALAYTIVDRLNWQYNQKQDAKQQASIEEEKLDIILITGGSIVAAIIMFIWDYLAYMIADSDDVCVNVFSGNTFFRKVLCFLLKIISMQTVPAITYYTIFYRRKSQFLSTQQIQPTELQEPDILYDDTASELNRSLTSRIDSRRTLFSGFGSTQNL